MKNRNLVLGIVLISLGALWFLDNLSIVDFSIGYLFGGLRDLWPLILVVLGIAVISKNKRVEQIVWILFLIILIAYSMLTHYNGSIFYRTENNVVNESEIKTINSSIPLEEGITEGVLDLDIGATQFNINTSQTDTMLYIDSNIAKLSHNTSRKNDTTQICAIENDGFNVNFDDMNLFSDIYLNNKLIWNIDIDCGAINGDINLQDVQIDTLDLDMGAGDLNLLLSNNSPSGKISVDSGASKINFKVPTDAGIKIVFDGALNSTNLSSLGLKQVDGTYYSENYETAKTKYDFDVNMGLGKFDINYY